MSDLIKEIEKNEKDKKDKEKTVQYEIEEKKYEMIGKGSFSTVYLGKANIYKIENNEKIYLKNNVSIALKELKDATDANNLNEILISSELSDNSHINKMIGILNFDNKTYIAYEYCNGGDLRQYINYFHRFDEVLIQVIMNQIVNGLIEFFEKNIVHHDIKPENILLKFSDDIKDLDTIKEILKNKNKNNINNNSFQNNNQFERFHNEQAYYNNIVGMNMNNNINNNMIIINNNNINNNAINNNINNNYMNINNNVNNNIYNNNFINMNNNINQNFNNNINNYFNNANNNFINANNNPYQFQQNNYYPQNNFNNNFSLNNNNNNFAQPNYSSYNEYSNTTSNINQISTKNQNNNMFKFKNFLNILKESTEYKLSDFGLSKSKNEILKRNLSGSPLYMAPELFKLDSELSEIENKQVDIWALGVLAYELFFGKRPFEAFSIEQLSQMYENGIYLINLKALKDDKGNYIPMSKEFFHFLNRCLQKDPEKRANIYELRNSHFLNYDIVSFEKMNEKEFQDYLKGLVEVDNFNNFRININIDYSKEIQKRNM